MKIPFPPLLKSAPRPSRTLISISVKKRQLFRPATRMTTKRWYGCPSSLWTSEKSQFSTCHLGGKKHLILRLGSRYRLRRTRKARRRLLCYPGSRRFGSVSRASLSRDRCEAFRLLPRIHVSNEFVSLPALAAFRSPVWWRPIAYSRRTVYFYYCLLFSFGQVFFFCLSFVFLVPFLFAIYSTSVLFIIFSSFPFSRFNGCDTHCQCTYLSR